MNELVYTCIHTCILTYMCVHTYIRVCVCLYTYVMYVYIAFTFSGEIRKIRDEKLYSTDRQYSNCESMAISFNISWLPIQPIFPSLIKMPS